MGWGRGSWGVVMGSERKLWIVTASTDVDKARRWTDSWRARASALEGAFHAVIVWNGVGQRPWPHWSGTRSDTTLIIEPDYLGVVPAFCLGLQAVIHRAQPHDVIACLHDDVEIFEQDWDRKVLAHFDAHPRTILAGFFGATRLGADELYKTDYDPMQLARGDCWSNMDDAEAHGQRSTEARRVVVLDGFSQIMRADFARYACEALQKSGVTHHAYDLALGCLAARWARGVSTQLGAETWMIPIHCHHAGGQTAVGDRGYQEWAAKKIKDGDQGFWLEAHAHFYEEFRDILPLRLGE